MIITVDCGSAIPPMSNCANKSSPWPSGVLPAGSRLPTIRQLATDLDLAPGTVNRAYRELENEGVIVSQGRHGSFISQPPVITGQERSRRLSTAAQKFARIAQQLGASDEEAQTALRNAQPRSRQT